MSDNVNILQEVFSAKAGKHELRFYMVLNMGQKKYECAKMWRFDDNDSIMHIWCQLPGMVGQSSWFSFGRFS